MIFAMISLWQISAQATDVRGGTYYDTKIDGITYRIWTYSLYEGIRAQVKEIPNIETVRIPSTVVYEGKIYKVTNMTLAGDKVKDIYIDSLYTSNTDYTVPNVTNLNPNCILHLRPNDFAHYSKPSHTHFTTDGKRWKGPTEVKRDGFIYQINYPSTYIPNVTITDVPKDQSPLYIPKELVALRDTVIFPVTSVEWVENFKSSLKSGEAYNESTSKHIYFSNVLPKLTSSTISGLYYTNVTLHVPDSLFDKACTQLGRIVRITNGKDIAYLYENRPYINILKDGYSYDIYGKSRTEKYAYIKKLPNTSTVIIPADVSYNDVVFPITDFCELNYTTKSIFADNGKNVKDVYFTRMIPSEQSYFSACFQPGDKNTVMHVPDSLFEKAANTSNGILYNHTYYGYRITDGTRWACKQVFTENVNGCRYRIYYSPAYAPYAELQKVVTPTASIEIPAEIKDEYATYPVKNITSDAITLGDPVKHIYFTTCIPSRIKFPSKAYNDAIIHVPDSLYDQALIAFGETWRVTDGKRTAYTGTKGIKFENNGFVYTMTFLDNGGTSVNINSIPQNETVTLPHEVTENGIVYPITSAKLDKDALSKTIKNLYISNVIPTLYNSNVLTCHLTLHTPDSLFNKILNNNKLDADYVTDGKRMAYNNTLHPTNFSYSNFYDNEGQGKMDIIRESYQLIDEKGTPYITNYANYQYSLINYNTKEAIVNNNKILASSTFADITGNGKKEIIGTLQVGYNKILRMAEDGSMIEDYLYVTTDTTEMRTIMTNDYTPNSGAVTKIISSGGSGLGSLADGMFVKSKENHFSNFVDESYAKTLINNEPTLTSLSIPTGHCSAADFNGDGFIDLNDGKYIYYNLGNNRFFRSSHTGSIYTADLTGNGLLDLIDFGSKETNLYICKSDGSYAEPKTLLKNTALENVFFGDFDKDGDVDILFFIPGNDYSLFQFYRNDGNGVFKAKDDNIDGKFSSIACNDYDGDGYYEILAKQNEKYYLLKCKNWTITQIPLPNNVLTLADVDNDGRNELIYSVRASYTNGYTVYDHLDNATANTRPKKMDMPSAVAFPDAGKLKISWNLGKDAQTSSCDLTYELRISSEPGKGDIYHANSNANGTRRLVGDGNMGRSLKYIFDTNNLNEGKYYIAIQAIDASGLGGEWSDELVYNHKLVAPVISEPALGYCTGDTINLSVQNPRKDVTYEWTLENGSIISQNTTGSMIKAIFDKAGNNEIKLAMLKDGQVYNGNNTSITLFPFVREGLKASDSNLSDQKAFYRKNRQYVDIDQDGNAEIFTNWYQKNTGYGTGGSFYETKDGDTWSKIRKTWNSDLSLQYIVTADYNHDGYPDFITESSKGNIFYNSGENDKSYDYDNVETNLSNSYAPYIDINNDGKLGFWNSGNFIYQSGNSLNVSEKIKDSNGYTIYPYGFYDFNCDGGIDYWKNVRNTQVGRAETRIFLKKNEGDYLYDEDGKLFYENEKEFNIVGFADFNNDGYTDGYYFDRPIGSDKKNLVIIKGKPMDEWPCKETVVIPLKKDTSIKLIDFDNNGYLDIYVYNGDYESTIGDVLLMDRDFKYTSITDVASRFGIQPIDVDEYHWQPLTPGAYPNGYKSNIKNEAPSAPTNATATSIPEGLLLKWDDATDDHTPWMQMRYNVSLKIKGKTGENAFVLSPMNGLSDDATICSGVYYRKASQVIVPKSALINGTTYELQVQAIDLMGEHSPMTKPVEVTYNAENAIVLENEEFYVTGSYKAKYEGSKVANLSVDAGDDGVVWYQEGKEFGLLWKTPGLKTITVNADGTTCTRTIAVKERPDLHVDLPKQAMLNSPIEIHVPKAFLSKKFDEYGFTEDDAFKVSYQKGDTIAYVTFKSVGIQKLYPYITINKVRIGESNVCTVVDEVMPTAEIKSVEADDQYYRVNWNTDVPSMVSKVEISRETNRLNQFEVLDIVPVANGSFVDLTSDNRVQPQRYRIRFIADNEMQYSDYSTPHNPLHVMINKTANKQGNNLMWNAYEGLDVASYIIMRGSSESNLKAIATIAGSQQNYTDYDAPTGVSYYAVKFEAVPAVLAKGVGTYAASEDVASNVISSEEAMPTTAATNLYAGTVESNAKLSTDQQELHMVATILPTYVTYNKVSWSIVSGGEYASISQSGLLTAKGGKGDVVVKVVTLDGSNLSDEITIPCDVTILAKDIDVRAAKKSVAVGDYLLLNAVLTPKNTTMNEVTWKSEDTDIATVDENGILKAITPGVVKVTATTKDGSNLAAYINIIVTEPTGINDVDADDKDADIIYYDLEGRKIQNPVKGHLYITNKGKKVVF